MKFLHSSVALAFVTMPLLAQPVITNQPVSRALWAGGNVKFAVGVSNSSAVTFQWLFNNTNLPNGIITTVAGNGTNPPPLEIGNPPVGFQPIPNFSGDGAAAVNATISAPSSVAVDALGDLFIVDSGNNRIRQINTNGIITTVAGNGAFAYSGDGGGATNASFKIPTDVIVDLSGSLFIPDPGNYRVREVGTNNIITTVAGNGSFGYSGDGGMATNAEFSQPTGVALDSRSDLFIADKNDDCIREVNTNGLITTIAGGMHFGYSGDWGAATNAGLFTPQHIILNTLGNIFIVDTFNNRIREVDTNNIIHTFAGNGTNAYSGDSGNATNASLNYPWGLTAETSGNVFIADFGNSRIRKIDIQGVIATFAGNGINAYSGDGGNATNASLNYPQGVAMDPYGNLFIADSANNRIRKVTNTQGPTLALNNVGATNAGRYQLVVNDSNGSVTSSIINLIVATAPLIYQTTVNPDRSVALNLISQPDSTNMILCATNLTPPVVWQPISTNVAGPDGNWQFTDTNLSSYQTKFYRSLTQ